MVFVDSSPIIPLDKLRTDFEVEESIAQVINRKKAMYYSDFKKFVSFCEAEYRNQDFDSMEKYLHQLITVKGIKYSTFNRRAAGIKFYLSTVFNLEQTSLQKKRLQIIRQLYNTEEYLRLKPMRGVRAEKQEEVIALINKFNTNNKSEIRKRAICYLNLITANRPSEMVRLKVSDIDLINRKVWVMLKKQGEMKEKSLTLECSLAIEKYIKAFKLNKNNYLVGSIDKWGNYKNKMISERSYNRLIHQWLGFPPYTFRKTQITSMYNKSADLVTIAKQSGHRSLQTITEHYIEVDCSEVEKYL
ncbi:site-specific recombinase XerD [Solibacillus silvestris StLB046]|uniref:Site-specific recombinase XerD n=1 Tax=Solibacillus silvestris (strain StLB046) TaxID=1002809 RepID=F2FA33_SOLSS|nr:site-specific integrase [Solibacillus silvestris]BAK15699.1 site-specific recombinase XerD [Solibacillus silvestris StLB046]